MINITSVKKYCKDYTKIENYNQAVNSTELWDCHHRREISENKSCKQLIKEGIYFNVKPEELIFLTHSEHSKLHNIGSIKSEEVRRRIRESLPDRSGKNNPMYDRKHSEEARKKMRENHADCTGENNSCFNTHWYNNGIINVRTHECSEGFTLGILKKNKTQ